MQSQMQPLSTPKLDDVYAEALPNSWQLFARAQQIFPDGVTHDNRRMQPFPIYGERAEGAYK
jgi:glutamate-1-semialdehyde 2,1-aminomutase